MAALVYAAICSLDGYVADADGRFDWSAPSGEVHAAVNDLQRPVGTMLLGRRMYDVLVAWEHLDVTGQSEQEQDYSRLWHATDKIVYSTTLDDVRSARTRLVYDFEPSEIAELKAQLDAPISIGGPTLAAQAFREGLVDEVHLFVHPVVVGGGTAALPVAVHLDLELTDLQRFTDGVVHAAYAVKAPSA